MEKGHATFRISRCIQSRGVLLVGYDHPDTFLIVKNCWGETWGEGGFILNRLQRVLW